jgi:hypothetical protein
MNAPQRILRAIGDKFDVDIVSEYEPQYWGFGTQEEWDAALAKMEEEADQDFYNNVIKFVQGEEHEIRPGTIGMTRAEIAKRLIEESPDLLAEKKRSDLIKAVNTIYDRDHTLRVTLTEKEVAFARMAATCEDDLPQA